MCLKLILVFTKGSVTEGVPLAETNHSNTSVEIKADLTQTRHASTQCSTTNAAQIYAVHMVMSLAFLWSREKKLPLPPVSSCSSSNL